MIVRLGLEDGLGRGAVPRPARISRRRNIAGLPKDIQGGSDSAWRRGILFRCTHCPKKRVSRFTLDNFFLRLFALGREPDQAPHPPVRRAPG
jgi:hypothetical protein